MSGRDWQAFDAELRARAPELAIELMGKPSFRAGQEWRWGRKGSLSVVIAGARAGMWFDHEAGEGGGLVKLVARIRGLNRREALDWTGDRIGMAGDFGMHPHFAKRVTRAATGNASRPTSAADSRLPEPGEEIGGVGNVATEPVGAASGAPEPEAANPATEAATRAARIWATAHPAPEDHPVPIRLIHTPTTCGHVGYAHGKF